MTKSDLLMSLREPRSVVMVVRALMAATPEGASSSTSAWASVSRSPAAIWDNQLDPSYPKMRRRSRGKMRSKNPR